MRRLMSMFRRVLIALTMACSALAQTPTRTLKAPTAAQRREMLAHLEARLAEYQQHMPAFACAPLLKLDDPEALEGSRVLPGTVVLDLSQSKHGPGEQGGAFSVDPLLRPILQPGAKFVFERWAIVRRKHVAVYRYKGKSESFHEAVAHVDREGGSVSEIVFRGVDTPSENPLLCRIQPEEAR